MYDLIATVHIVVAVLLILLVLVQDSKGGAGMFAGGSSQSILGATGGATLLAKLSRGTAILFAITCIMLTIYTSRQSNSIVDDVTAPAAVGLPPATTETPVTTEAAPAKDAAPAAKAPKAETKKK
jgi:preprotein translocase subunit SecG